MNVFKASKGPSLCIFIFNRSTCKLTGKEDFSEHIDARVYIIVQDSSKAQKLAIFLHVHQNVRLAFRLQPTMHLFEVLFFIKKKKTKQIKTYISAHEGTLSNQMLEDSYGDQNTFISANNFICHSDTINLKALASQVVDLTGG